VNATTAALAAVIADDPTIGDALAHLTEVLGGVDVVTVEETVIDTDCDRADCDIAPADPPADSVVIRFGDTQPGDVVRLAWRWMTVDRVADLGLLRYPPTVRLYVHDDHGHRFETEDRPDSDIAVRVDAVNNTMEV
jgi:hypothetical protein